MNENTLMKIGFIGMVVIAVCGLMDHFSLSTATRVVIGGITGGVSGSFFDWVWN